MRATTIEAACLFTVLAFSDAPAHAPVATGYGGDMVAAAEAFLATLDDDARAKGVFAFDDEERFNFHYIPRARNGLPLEDMSQEQRSAAHLLMQSVLSSQGYLKATGVMQLEGILGALENRPGRRNPEDYYFSIFGTPASDAAWGWRFEGHHISLNFTSVTGDVLVTTPAFMGSNPHVVGGGPNAGWRLLGAEEDLARALLSLLNDGQRQQAVIADSAPRDVITGADRQASLERFEGLPAQEMNDVQRDALMQLVGEYLHNMRPEIARAQMEKIHSAGVSNLYFAWAGSLQRGEGHYYRVHGPTILLEYDNVQGGANHVHSVWRNLTDDFGGDLLRKHYEESDHHQDR